jgi:hypothetical protein
MLEDGVLRTGGGGLRKLYKAKHYNFYTSASRFKAVKSWTGQTTQIKVINSHNMLSDFGDLLVNRRFILKLSLNSVNTCREYLCGF